MSEFTIFEDAQSTFFVLDPTCFPSYKPNILFCLISTLPNNTNSFPPLNFKFVPPCTCDSKSCLFEHKKHKKSCVYQSELLLPRLPRSRHLLSRSKFVFSFSRSSGEISVKEDLIINYSIIDSENSSSNVTAIWSCFQLNSSCVDSQGNLINLTYTPSSLTINKTILAGLSSFSLQVLATSLNSSDQISLNFTVLNSSNSCQVPWSSQRLNPDIPSTWTSKVSLLSGVQFLWDLSQKGGLGNFNTFPYLVLSENTLQQGQGYILKLTTSTGGESMSSFIEILVNKGPVCDKVAVVKYLDEYNISAQNCLDPEELDYPIFYQFGCQTDRVFWLTSLTQRTYSILYLPAQAKRVCVRAVDSLGTSSNYSALFSAGRRTTDYIMQVMSICRDPSMIPNAVIYFSSLQINFATFSYLYSNFFSYFKDLALDRFTMDVYLGCLSALLSLDSLISCEIVNNSTDFTIKILGNYKYQLFKTQSELLMKLYSSQSCLSNAKKIQILETISVSMIKNLMPPFEHYFSANLSVINIMNISSSFTAFEKSSDSLSVSFPGNLSISLYNTYYFSIIYIPENETIALYSYITGNISSYTLNLTPVSSINLTFNSPIKLSIPFKNQSLQCLPFCNLSSSGNFTTVSLFSVGVYTLEPVVPVICVSNLIAFSISLTFLAVALVLALVFYCKDRKISEKYKGYSCNELCNLSGVFISRANPGRVLSLFRLTSSMLTIICATGVTYTDLAYQLEALRAFLGSFSVYNCDRILYALTSCQILSFVNNVWLCGGSQNSVLLSLNILLNISISVTACALVFFISETACFSYRLEWIQVSFICCGVELGFIQPLTSCFSVFFCKKNNKTMPMTTRTQSSDMMIKSSAEPYSPNDTLQLFSVRPSLIKGIGNNIEDAIEKIENSV